MKLLLVLAVLILPSCTFIYVRGDHDSFNDVDGYEGDLKLDRHTESQQQPKLFPPPQSTSP